jgi:transcriptional regulator with XRE-family HTH domain
MKYELNRNKIKGVLAEQNKTQRDVAKKLKLSETQTSKKLKNIVDLKVSEFLILCDFLESEPSLFFSQTVDENRTN